MTSRRLQVLAALPADDDAAWLPTLCRLATTSTGVDGVGLTLRSRSRPGGSIASSNPVARRLDALQDDVGEGPCHDAVSSGAPVLAPDLRDTTATDRWPVFARLAATVGGAATFSFPLGVDRVRIGTMNLYRAVPGPLTDEQCEGALAVADVAARAILVLQARADPGRAAPALSPRDLDVVHQAAGMASVQLGLPVDTALTRLRGLAFLHDLPLERIALDVLERRLRLDEGEVPGV